VSLAADLRAAVQQRVSGPPPLRASRPLRTAKAQYTGDREVATATLKPDDGESITFQFAPDTIKIGHGSDSTQMDSALGIKPKEKTGGKAKSVLVAASGEAVVNVGDTTITFGEILLDGSDVPAKCRQLLRWTYPVEKKKNSSEDPTVLVVPLLTFTWGSFQSGIPHEEGQDNEVKLVLTKVDIDYSRFTAQGVPTRAKVVLNTKVMPLKKALQNPTSGGLPDRRGHVVVDGESLHGIARAEYGSPGRWRELAEHNGIDDPLRVRPGHRLYLPGAAELAGDRR
jgi:nucleoid-associated protein YgaU